MSAKTLKQRSSSLLGQRQRSDASIRIVLGLCVEQRMRPAAFFGFWRGRYREKGKGRHKQSKAKNLLDALLERADQVLARLIDLRIPFTNNQAERDLSMAKVGT